jgi:hypothetical protein
MKKSIWAVLGIVVVALAVPAAALATHHRGGVGGHHGHIQTGVTGANSVTSYSDGKLVLLLADGTSVTGLVTSQTRFDCVGEGLGSGNGRWSRGRGRGHDRYNWRRGYGSTGPSGPSGATGAHGKDWSGPSGATGARGTTGGKGWSGGGGGYTSPPCDSSLLVANATVLSAELAITGHGALFGEIVLLPAVQ